jgi:hypothetical protein
LIFFIVANPKIKGIAAIASRDLQKVEKGLNFEPEKVGQFQIENQLKNAEFEEVQ